MAFHNWHTKPEREQKKQYIYTCRKIVKAMVRDGWLTEPPEGSSWDHSFSCQIANLSHLSLYVVNSVPNLKIMSYKQNNRKGTRCYIRVEELIDEFNKWNKKDEFKKYVDGLLLKWNVDHDRLIQPINVDKVDKVE